MLSIGKLANGQANYYLDLAGERVDRSSSVASGVEDYYVGGAEPPGRWGGALASEVRLKGQVEAKALKALLDESGGDPSEPRPRRKVPGFDLTFSAPKSVSVVFGIADDDVQRRVMDAHRVAVESALAYLEREAVRVRRGQGGREVIGAGGLLAAAFDHRTSRAGDPQLHTHVLIANQSRGADGRWSALDGRLLYRHAKTAGYVYQAVLRSEITERVGLGWAARAQGVGEVAGVPAEVLKAFSRRRAEIVAELERLGAAGRSASQVATLATRRAKDYRVSPESLMPGWRARAEELGFGVRELRALLERGPVVEPRIEQPELFAELRSPSGMTARRSTFTRRDLLQVLAERSDPSERVTVVGLQLMADAFLASEEVVRVTEVGEPRYSVRELIAKEREIVELATLTGGKGVPVASDAGFKLAVERRPALTSEQRRMVERLTREERFVQIVVGKAGTGKTFALDAAREAWEASGVQVFGVAVARRAARELEEGAGIRSTSLSAMLHELGDLRSKGLPRGCVVVVDEAGMVPTRAMHGLAHHVRRAGGKLVLVGDFRQLPEVEAGGVFGALAVRTHAIELRDNRRQERGWEREALELLRAGDAARAIAPYRARGELTVAPSADQIRETLVDDWWRAEGGESLMIAFRRSDVADLNRRARARMQAAGRLHGDEVIVQGAPFAAGDHVVVRRGDWRLGVVNGDRGTVVATNADIGALRVRLRTGATVVLDRRFLTKSRAGLPAVQHGYAVTGHVAQGLTTDRTFVLGTDRLFREWGYVAMSRGRLSNRMYAVVGEPIARDEFAPARRQIRPLEDLVDRLERPDRQLTTTDEAYAAEYAALSDPALRGQLAQLRAARFRDRSDPELRARVAMARDELHRRAAILSRAAALDAPGHLEQLGLVPDGHQARHGWESAAGAIEEYRIEFGVDDAASPLGARPENPGQLVRWRDAQREAGRQRGVDRGISRD
jgi:conjugative relaxase-like TrwC/TraI family protein